MLEQIEISSFFHSYPISVILSYMHLMQVLSIVDCRK